MLLVLAFGGAGFSAHPILFVVISVGCGLALGYVVTRW